jgi:hypothetical protein
MAVAEKSGKFSRLPITTQYCIFETSQPVGYEAESTLIQDKISLQASAGSPDLLSVVNVS